MPLGIFGVLWGWPGGVRGLRGTPLGGKSKKTPGDQFLGSKMAPILVPFLIKIPGTNYADKIN